MPITTSTVPSAIPARTALASRSLLKRDSTSTRTGRPTKRSATVSKCCCARTVVGTIIATWYPLATARKAARIATSVLPKPTSPETSRSMGTGRSMSARVASIAIA